MTTMTATEARDHFSELLNRVVYGSEAAVVTRRGKPFAAIVSYEDLRLLERLREQEEDRQDIAAARTALAEPEPSVSWGQVKAELGL